MSAYLIINLAIILFPLLLSFDRKIKFYRKLPHILISMCIVGAVYISWDIFAVSSGHWSFNPEFVSGIYIAGLPLEEILFFVTVPYSMLFLYEVLAYYFSPLFSKDLKLRESSIIAGILMTGLAIIFNGQGYTFISLFVCGLFLLLASELKLINSGIYWVYVAFSFIPFLIVNYVLTSLPVVLYNKKAIWGTRFLTIPLEDFFYSFAMISFYLAIYKLSLRLSGRKKEKPVLSGSPGVNYDNG